MQKIENMKWLEFLHFFKNGGELEFQVSRTDIGKDNSKEFWNYCPESYIPFGVNPPLGDLAAWLRLFGTPFANILVSTISVGGSVEIKKILPDSYGIKLVI
jgi:hypothetical protein